VQTCALPISLRAGGLHGLPFGPALTCSGENRGQRDNKPAEDRGDKVLNRVDRVQLAVPDAEEAARGWISLLGAEKAGEDRIAGLGARRLKLRLGNGWVELLTPDGAGQIADAVSARGAQLYAGGVT